MMSHDENRSLPASGEKPSCKPPLSQTRYAWLPIPVGMIFSQAVFSFPPLFPAALCYFVKAICPDGRFIGRIPNCFGIYYDLYNIVTAVFGGLVGVIFSRLPKRKAFLLLLGLILFYALVCNLAKAFWQH